MRVVAVVIAVAINLLIVQAAPVFAAKARVLYAFGEQTNDGAFVVGSLLRTKSGALYVVTNGGCTDGDGGVFELTQSSRHWKIDDVYCFRGGTDGDAPWGGVIADKKGRLYGTTTDGGEYGYGTVYQLTPANGRWLGSIIYSFKESEARNPVGDLITDSNGTLYGVAQKGGSGECGGVFKVEELKGHWKENVLAAFNGNNGCMPYAGLHMDANGTIYGTAEFGGAYSAGVAFSVSEQGDLAVLHDFSISDGASPECPLVESSSGTLYGTTSAGGSYGLGTIFALAQSGGVWTETVLHNFSGSDGANPVAGLAIDASGILYGTTRLGGRSNYGVVLRLIRHDSSWTESVIHSFGGAKDGIDLTTPVTNGGGGVFYGATQGGGKYGFGTIYEIVRHQPASAESGNR